MNKPDEGIGGAFVNAVLEDNARLRGELAKALDSNAALRNDMARIRHDHDCEIFSIVKAAGGRVETQRETGEYDDRRLFVQRHGGLSAYRLADLDEVAPPYEKVIEPGGLCQTN